MMAGGVEMLGQAVLPMCVMRLHLAVIHYLLLYTKKNLEMMKLHMFQAVDYCSAQYNE